MKQRIRLTEGQLINIIRRCVNEANAWDDGYDNGPQDFDMYSGYPTVDTRSRYPYISDEDRKVKMAREMGREPSDYDDLCKTKNPFATSNNGRAQQFTRYGRTQNMINKGTDPYRFMYHDIRDWDMAEQDYLEAEKQNMDKFKRNTNMAISSADKCPLHRKGSLNREL